MRPTLIWPIGDSFPAEICPNLKGSPQSGAVLLSSAAMNLFAGGLHG